MRLSRDPDFQYTLGSLPNRTQFKVTWIRFRAMLWKFTASGDGTNRCLPAISAVKFAGKISTVTFERLRLGHAGKRQVKDAGRDGCRDYNYEGGRDLGPSQLIRRG